MSKAVTKLDADGEKPKSRKKARFEPRISVRLDQDVQELGNAILDRVSFRDLSHAVNAGLRRAYAPLKPENMTIRIDPFEQAVFDGHLIIKRLQHRLHHKRRQRKARK